MPTPWQLSYPGTVLPFGPAATGLPLSQAPEFGAADLTVDDQVLAEARADGVGFGADFRGGTTITFTLHAIDVGDVWANARMGEFIRAWRADGIRLTPGAVAELRAPSGRSAFGRPRRVSYDETLARYGKYALLADFATADDLWYGDEESLTVPFALAQGGGFVFPLKFPLVARGYTTRQNTFTVGGEQPTWPIVTIRGPILNPAVEVAGRFRFAAATSLAYDEFLTIDTRPGRQSVLRNGSQIAALSRSSTLLPEAYLPPGGYTFTLSGSSSTGNPNATIAWRPAHPTP